MMHFYKRVFLFVCLCLTTIPLYTQEITGWVKDSNNTVLPSAQVMLRQGDAIKAFAMTDAEGLFDLDLSAVAGQQDSVIVEIRYFGYATQRIVLSNIDLEDELIVILKEKGVELKEVVVSAEALPQITKGDTLIYRTDAYRDGSEKKIEEVIAKLPGVEVDEEGTIKVKGKLLDRILVDGEDLFDKNYKLLSRNIPANLVGRIDLINDYQQDALVGDLSTESETVFNLHLDPDQKRPVFGEVGGELGTQATRAAHGNFFHFGKKTKAVNFSDYNSLGSTSSVGDVLLRRTQGLNSRHVPAGRNVLRSEATRGYRLVRTEDYLKNDAYGTAQTILTRIGKKAKNRLIFNLSGENYRLDDERLRENISTNRIDSFIQQNDYDYRTTGFWLMNDFDVLLNKKSRLDFRINLKGESNRAGVTTLNELIGGDGPENIGTNLTERPITLLNSLRYVRRLNPTTALRVSASWSKENINQRQTYRGIVYDELPGVPGVPEIVQVYDQKFNDLVFETDLMREVGKFKWNHTVGHRRNRTLTETSLAASGAAADAVQSFDYRLEETYLASGFLRKFGKLELSANLILSRFHLNSGNVVDEEKEVFERFAFQPKTRISYKLNRRNTLSLWANSTRSNQSPDELVNSPYLASGSTLSVGLDTSYLVRRNSAGLSYTYNNAFNQYSYGADVTYQRTPNGIRSSVATEDFVIVNKLIPGFASGMTSASVRADKYFSGMKLNLKLNVNYTVLDDQLNLGGELVDFRTISRSVNVEISKKIGEKFSYGWGTVYSKFFNQFSAGNSRQRQIKGRQRLVYQPSKLTKVNLVHNAYFPRIGSGNKAVHLLSGELNHEVKKHSLTVGVGIRNAFNVKTIEERSVSVYQRFGRTYELRPRTLYVLLTKTF